jgi:xanthine dehydrogenase YagS FAD-binding subunit
LGAAAPVPHRAKEAEAALQDKELTRENALAAADAALASATPMTLNKYKIPLFRNLIARTILTCAGAQPAPTGEGAQS